MRRARLPRCVAVLTATVVLGPLAGCGDDAQDAVADERAGQIRDAVEATSLDAAVTEFLVLLSRADLTTWEVTYPGPQPGSTLVVTNAPPDRRVDLLVDGDVVEVRYVVDGEAFTCAPLTPGGPAEDCERTDAFVDPPGVFRAGDVDDLATALAERVDDFTLDVRTLTVAGVEATCLVTAIRTGRERADLGDGGTLCAAPTGAIVLVDQDGQRLEASAYTTDVAASRLRLPER